MVGFQPIIRQLIKDREFQTLTIFVIFTLLVGAIFYHEVEDWRWIDSFYFCVMTLTTVGYGDLYPITDIGKIFTTLYVLIGIGILFGYIKIVAQTVLKNRTGLIDLLTEKTIDLGKKLDMKKTKELNENSTEKHKKD